MGKDRYICLVKPLLTFGLPQALEKIKKLETEQQALVSINIRTEQLVQQKEQEVIELRAALQDALQQLKQKEAYIDSLLEQVAEGVRKGWQVEELQRMIYGRRSERFVPEAPGRTDATQLSLGDDFAASAPAEVSTIPVVEPAADAPAQTPAGRTSRKQKRHVAHRGKKDFPAHLPRQDRYHQPSTDVTGWTKTGEVVKERYDYRPGQLIVIRDICPVYQHPENKEICSNPGPAYLLEKGIAGPGCWRSCMSRSTPIICPITGSCNNGNARTACCWRLLPSTIGRRFAWTSTWCCFMRSLKSLSCG